MSDLGPTHRSSLVHIQITLALPTPAIDTRPIRSHSIKWRRRGSRSRGRSLGNTGMRYRGAKLLLHRDGIWERWTLGDGLNRRRSARDIANGRQHIVRLRPGHSGSIDRFGRRLMARHMDRNGRNEAIPKFYVIQGWVHEAQRMSGIKGRLMWDLMEFGMRGCSVFVGISRE